MVKVGFFFRWVSLILLVALVPMFFWLKEVRRVSLLRRLISKTEQIGQVKLGFSPLFSSKLGFITLLAPNSSFKVVDARYYGFEQISPKLAVKKFNFSACINASLFDDRNKPLGLLVMTGKVVQGIHKSKGSLRGLLLVTEEGVIIQDFAEPLPKNILEGFQGSKIITSNSEISKHIDQLSSQISGVCLNNQSLTIFAINSVFLKPSLLLTYSGFECKRTLILDSGSSTSFYLDWNGTIVDVHGSRAVPTLFCALIGNKTLNKLKL